MAANVTLPGTGEVVAAAEVGGAKIQQIYVLPVPLTAGSPTSVTVSDTGSTVLVAANASRRSVTLCNRSSGAVSISFEPSVPQLNKGITIDAGGSWKMDVDTFTTVQINAIAESAGSSVAVQEFTA